jgi:uncharacterized protein YutE (UPF0331/DUF86 family)
VGASNPVQVDRAALAEHIAHRAIGAMLDACYHLSAKQLKRAPSTPHDALDALVAARVLPGDRAAARHAMFRVRDPLVHGHDLAAYVDAAIRHVPTRDRP